MTTVKEVSDYQPNKVFGMDFWKIDRKKNMVFVKHCLSILCVFVGCSVWNPILLLLLTFSFLSLITEQR